MRGKLYLGLLIIIIGLQIFNGTLDFFMFTLGLTGSLYLIYEEKIRQKITN